MKLKRIVAIATAASSIMSMNTVAFADTEGSTEVEIRTEATLVDVTVPSTLPIVFNEDGSVIGGVDISTGPGKNLRTTSASGTYEITDEKIIIDWTEIDNQIKDFPLIPDSEHPYLYEDNTLRLFSGDGKAELIRQELE